MCKFEESAIVIHHIDFIVCPKRESAGQGRMLIEKEQANDRKAKYCAHTKEQKYVYIENVH